MPWLGYHFWMSTFTMVHHTLRHIPFKSSNERNAAQAQLNGTVQWTASTAIILNGNKSCIFLKLLHYLLSFARISYMNELAMTWWWWQLGLVPLNLTHFWALPYKNVGVETPRVPLLSYGAHFGVKTFFSLT
ncbi:hypothetical protein BT93_L1974 [Corymbia citriodora subsp. variegata]|uniref:Uncharacterized protein n=1 Tax=Corymbia citriodora subsp. variegata TaxID=360336 RepID=A0A8T0CL77_CORYI|nr:hypothetical protein BT93_L1974 [Corymbia citriodora subsp. variegata]KAF7848409.1 hypothetical protein BT93_L1974 [Corymbia citriodora subsp. variegata]KAF7848410.1 hypothetical protein BT93_L1974 [Corymbia citriodora subsp. variegata]